MLTVAEISGVGVTSAGAAGVWVGSEEQEVSKIDRRARAGKTIARMETVLLRNKENLRAGSSGSKAAVYQKYDHA